METKHLTNVAKKWHDEICTGKLDCINAWNDLNDRVLKIPEYPLPVTTCICDEFRATFFPVLEGGHPVAGICRNMHQEIVHGQLKYQGLGISSLYTTQGTSHVEALLDAP